MDILNRPVSEINATIALAPRATYESVSIQRSQTQMGHQAQRQLSAWPPAGMGSRVGFATVETAITRKAGPQAGPRPRLMLPESAPIRPRTTIKAAHIEIATTRRTLSLPLGPRPPRHRYRQSANAPKMARIKRIPGKGLAGRSSGETKTSNTRHLRCQLHQDRGTFYTTDEETACASATSCSLPVLTS